MFTGIVEETGTVQRLTTGGVWGKISVLASRVTGDARRGDSIAVNGVCLTVTDLFSGGFTADVMAETLRRTNLGSLKAGQHVNLERAMAANGRFGGHIVSGHIDSTGELLALTQEGFARRLTIAADAELLELVVSQGSIAIDGISLTVARRLEDRFEVSLIPTTQSDTTLTEKRPGDRLNLETDLIGKYVRALLRPAPPETAAAQTTPAAGGLTAAFLAEHGF